MQKANLKDGTNTNSIEKWEEICMKQFYKWMQLN